MNKSVMVNKAKEYSDMEQEIRVLLHQKGLRVTAPCLAVLKILAGAKVPLSHTEVLEGMGEDDCDQATVYRNLIKLRDAGLARVVSQADGVDRYAFVMPGNEGHAHPHFYCTACEQILCLPPKMQSLLHIEGPWHEAVQQAVWDLRGTCPMCREKKEAS
ncbi:Fur family transcriptional regulator [Pontiella agarivorans]|uniref:Transcriptional repressor n=1 Tax=Pontiella agarivorans TaxID=3038953 RepID=A0ABU5MUR2_9BACT|nr:transcriptional repressor [Pontiella agarivorans]MDZ8117900.1 transcriptional repressor [Pontiella agarivorans]